MTITLSKKVFVFGLGVTVAWPALHIALYPYWFNRKARPEKTVIITGATGNMGKTTAYNYAMRKCRVIMACRDMDKCKAFRRELVLDTKNKSIVCRHLDLEDINSINKFADEILETEPHLDILINSAAVKETDGKEMSKYGVEKHFFVNFIAQYLLTFRLLPLLEKSAAEQKDARIVNITGKPKKTWNVDVNDINFDRRRYTNERAYGQSKLAFAYFTILLNNYLRERDSHVYVYASGIDVKKVAKAFDHESGKWTRMFSVVLEVFRYDPFMLCGIAVKCGLDDSLGLNESGCLFKYGLRTYGRNNGWGAAGGQELQAKLAWNYATDFLVNLPKSSDIDSNGRATEPEKPQPINKTAIAEKSA